MAPICARLLPSQHTQYVQIARKTKRQLATGRKVLTVERDAQRQFERGVVQYAIGQRWAEIGDLLDL